MTYDEKIASELCERVMTGRSLRDVCRDDDMPNVTNVFRWIAAEPDFAKQYARATSVRAEIMFDEMFEIADDSSNDWMERDGRAQENPEAINRSKIRLDIRKWALARMNPRKYGEKIALGGDEDAPPIKMQNVFDVSNLTLEELAVFEKAITKAK